MVMHDSYPGKDTLWQNYTLKKFIPFNPVDKFTMAIVQENATGKIQRVMKGAPQASFPLPPEDRSAWEPKALPTSSAAKAQQRSPSTGEVAGVHFC